MKKSEFWGILEVVGIVKKYLLEQSPIMTSSYKSKKVLEELLFERKIIINWNNN